MKKIGFALRIGKVKVTLLHTDLVQNAVFRLLQPFFERLTAFVLDKLIGVLIRP